MLKARQRDLTRRQLRWGMLIAYLLHLFILGMFVFHVIPQQYHPTDRPFWFHHGGDNVDYFNLARDLLNGVLRPNKYPLGFPLLLMPFIVVVQPHDQQDLLEIVAAFWAILAFPLGQWLLGWLAKRLTGKRWLALFAVLFWTGLPIIIYLLARLVSTPAVAEISAIHLTWAHMLSDGPATLFTLLFMALYFWGRSPNSARWALGLGALGGFLMLIRLTGALSVGLVAGLLLFERRWRSTAILVVSAGLVFLPQMLYNWHFFGGPLTTGYQILDTLPPEGLFNLTYLTDALAGVWARLGLLLPLTVLALLGLASIGLRFLWKQSRYGAWVVGIWIASYAVFYSIYYYSWIGGLARFLIPIYPGVAILGAGVIGWIAEIAGQRSAQI